MEQQPDSLVTYEGQVIHRRALSKKIVFIDIKRTCPDNAQPKHVELVVKLDIYGTVEDVQAARDCYHLGDVIRATGKLDTDGNLLVTSMSHISHWSSTSGGAQFQPEAESVAWWNQTFAARKAASKAQQPQGTPADAAAPAQPQSVCKFWINTGRCMRGDSCTFAHTTGTDVKATRKRFLEDRMAKRKLGAAEDGFFVHDEADASAKRARAVILAQWLVDTWGVEALNRGSGVLDVAGGRGALSWQLQVVHGVKVTLVEPRPFKMNKQQHKAIKALRKQAALQEDQALQEPQPEPAGDPVDADDAAAVQEGRRCRLRHVQLAPGLQIAQVNAWFDERLWQAAVRHEASTEGAEQVDEDEEVEREVLQCIADCSVVVGLHPDQATEHIIMYVNAAPARKPFAIVPCCVFPRLYPHRRLKLMQTKPDSTMGSIGQVDDGGMWEPPVELLAATGATSLREGCQWQPAKPDDMLGPVIEVPVIRYAQLVQWLVQQGGHNTALSTLSMEGANQIVFKK